MSDGPLPPPAPLNGDDAQKSADDLRREMLSALRWLFVPLCTVASGYAAYIANELSTISEVFDNTVEGGLSSIPAFSKLVLDNRVPLLLLAGITGLTAIFTVLKTRRIKLLMMIAGLTIGFNFAILILMRFATEKPMWTVVTKFSA